MTLALSGHAVSPGIAIGQAHLIHRNEIDIGEHRIAPDQVATEIHRLRESLDAARAHLSALAASLHERGGETAEDVVRTHIQMLEDSSLTGGAEQHIREQLCNAEWALQLQLEGLLNEFRKVEDDYLRGRAEDVGQVVRLVQRMLASGAQAEDPAIPDRLVETLVVASELAPGELAALHQRGVAGVITEHGSPHSHSAIVARSLGIPAVMGVHRAQALLREGEPLVLDGHYGVGFASPDEGLVRHYLVKQAGSQRYQDTLREVRDQPAITVDGVTLTLLANAERDVDLKEAVNHGADGVGLFRTENLYLQGRAPMEEQQLAAFRMALAILGERPLTIRTLDLGAERSDGRLDFTQLRHVTNPALGLRAVRLCLREQDLFRTQLRAILRASAAGSVRCLIPMLTSVREVQMVRALLDEVREELESQGHPFDPDMPLGGMIEVPAAALAVPELAAELDFLSVGTNDLIQYALAADRVDEQVAHLYDPQHPGVVSLLHTVFAAAGDAGLPVSVCGEMAGDRRYTRLLLALGLREFSMPPARLLEVKKVALETDAGRARAALGDWLGAPARRAGMQLVEFLDQSQR